MADLTGEVTMPTEDPTEPTDVVERAKLQGRLPTAAELLDAQATASETGRAELAEAFEPDPIHLDPNLVAPLRTLVGNFGARGVVLAVEAIEPGAIPEPLVAHGEGWPARTVTDAELPARLQAAVADHQALEAVLDWAEVVHDPSEATVAASPAELAERLLEELGKHGWYLARDSELKGAGSDRPKADADQRREAVAAVQYLATELRLTTPGKLLEAADEVADYLAAGPKPAAATGSAS